MMDDKVLENNVLLELKDFKVKFEVRKKLLNAVDGVNLKIHSGEIVGVVGESGSGKSVMSQSIVRLREHDSLVHYEGEVLFEGKNLLDISLKEMSNIRGNEIAYIFQDPLTSLNPVYTVGKQIVESLIVHKNMKKEDAKERALELLKLVKISDPKRCFGQYPYELSGGMQQRVIIAMALSCEPKMLIADEPTTALDATVQEQILQLMVELNQKMGMTILFITHDLGVVAELCHTVRVMYLGQIIEETSTKELFNNPSHPYSQGLLACIPRLDFNKSEMLPVIEGIVPSLSNIPEGCNFSTRCKWAEGRCFKEEPPLVNLGNDHFVKCWKYVDEQRG